jgi:HSP20 family molecular chaperone IbpA
MKVVATGHPSRRRVSVREKPAEYVVAMDVADFARDELMVEAAGHVVTVRGDHGASDDAEPFVLHERLDESFRLPDDASSERVSAVYRRGALEIHAGRRRLTRRTVPVERDSLAGSVPQGC